MRRKKVAARAVGTTETRPFAETSPEAADQMSLVVAQVEESISAVLRREFQLGAVVQC